jgi:hypothetical protein
MTSRKENGMSSLRNVSLGCVALLVLGMFAGCSGGTEAENPFAGVHVFEGRVSESGGNFVLQVGGESFTLEGNNEEIRKFSGQSVQVSAYVEGTTLKVMRIAAAEPLAVPDQS